ncbi:MAG: hypothetical protein JW788_07665, partial [Candidatus Omnitrophica bacterium]|nr:hypothetical protein [Candidatus Omnitrophota bacterium]
MGLKVVFFNRSFYPDLSATSQLLTELCQDLIRDYGCQVTVVSGKPLLVEKESPRKGFGLGLTQEDSFNEIRILRVKNTAFARDHLIKRFFNYVSYFILSFLASFKLKKPDIVVTLTDPPIIGLLGM